MKHSDYLHFKSFLIQNANIFYLAAKTLTNNKLANKNNLRKKSGQSFIFNIYSFIFHIFIHDKSKLPSSLRSLVSWWNGTYCKESKLEDARININCDLILTD